MSLANSSITLNSSTTSGADLRVYCYNPMYNPVCDALKGCVHSITLTGTIDVINLTSGQCFNMYCSTGCEILIGVSVIRKATIKLKSLLECFKLLKCVVGQFEPVSIMLS
jgi:hypothetical protein